MADNEETFPSFRKAYKYRGGFDKFVYDKLSELLSETKTPSEEQESDKDKVS